MSRLIRIALAAWLLTMVGSVVRAECHYDGSGSESISGSGNFYSADGHYLGHYYYYTYQYAHVYRGELWCETHTISLRGYLGDAGPSEVCGVSGGYVIHRYRGFLLAVPWVEGLGVMIKFDGVLDSPCSSWIPLCQR